MDVRRIVLAGGVIVVVVAGITYGLVTRADRSIVPEVDWSEPRRLPSPARPDFRSEFVGDDEGFRFFPRSARVQRNVAYAFDTGHCGLGFLTDFDGSFWRPIDPDRADSFDLLNDQDTGAIALVARNRAVYRSSAEIEIRMERIDGPVVTQACG